MGISRYQPYRVVVLFVILSWFFLGCAHRGAKAPPKITGTYPPKKSKPYQINGVWYWPLSSAGGYKEKGIASWYGADFHGKRTANGEIYNMYSHTAAHKTLPFNTYVRVTNLENGKSTIVRINDRGPFVRNRIIDLSYAAAKDIEIARAGTAPVIVETVALAHYKPKAKKHWVMEKPPNPNIGNFTLQVGSFRDPTNAFRLKCKLAAKYPHVKVIPSYVGSEKLYRVRLFHFSTLTEAKKELQRMWALGYADAFVVAE